MPAPRLPPLFIVGTERSGSNLLRLMLDAHPRIAVPHPPHVVHYFAPLQPRYGDLADPARFARLVRDVRRLLDTHIHPWEVPVDWDRVEAEGHPRDVFGISWALYDQYAAARGKARWGDKSTFMVAWADRVLQDHPGALLVWLHRDPRDVAASARTSVFSATHPVFAAELWRDQQALAAAAEARHPDRVLRVAYEALVTAPERELRRICAALGEPWDPAMLDYPRGHEAARSSALSESWALTAKPPDAGRVGRHQAALSEEERGNVEAICAAGMALLGYTPSGAAGRATFTEAERARFRARERWDDLGIELRSLRRDANVWRRWRRALLLAWLRRRP